MQRFLCLIEAHGKEKKDKVDSFLPGNLLLVPLSGRGSAANRVLQNAVS